MTAWQPAMEVENASAPKHLPPKSQEVPPPLPPHTPKTFFVLLCFAFTTEIMGYVNVENENASPTSKIDVAFHM